MEINKSKKMKEIKKDIQEKVKGIVSMQDCKTDPNGSYTGVPKNLKEQPVQDVDDL